MADFVFNVAKGRAAYYALLPAANDGLVAVPLLAAGLETDAVLRDKTTLTAVLAGATNESPLGRKALTAVTSVPDQANDRTDADAGDITWTAATGDALGAVVICYDPDTTVGIDDDLIPLTKHDFATTPSGGDLVAQIAVAGFYRAL